MSLAEIYGNPERGRGNYTSVMNAFMFAGVCESFDGWFSANEVHEAVCKRVYQVTLKTSGRYLRVLSIVGVIESKKDPYGKWAFKWVGYPDAIR